MILLTTYYLDDLADRQRELDVCLTRNLSNPLLESIILFVDGTCGITHQKLHHIAIGDRLTYQVAFEYANSHLVDQICILANSDIFFDESLARVAEADLTDKFYAITRYNVKPDNSLVLNDSNACQDVWIFKSPLKAFASTFGLGMPGCDNRIAFEAISAGLKVLNPCFTIRCHHLHNTNKRNYVQNQPVIPGPHARVEFGDQL